jgi:hypothetical protein
MKRTFAAVATAVVASTSIWLASTPAYAKQDTATIAVTRWTYQGGGKIAVIAKCSYPQDVRVVSSKILPHLVTLRSGGNLLIKVTDKTKPGKYIIALWCETKKGQIDALAEARVKILMVLPEFHQPSAPALPRHFKANVTVSSGPPVVAKTKK